MTLVGLIITFFLNPLVPGFCPSNGVVVFVTPVKLVILLFLIKISI